MDERLQQFKRVLDEFDDLPLIGKVSQIIGLTIESEGPDANIGDLCKIQSLQGTSILAEVVGFRNERILLMPLAELTGIGPGSYVTSLGEPLKVTVGPELIGRVLDGLGNPIDGKGAIRTRMKYPINNSAVMPLNRQRISKALPVGVRAIDGVLSCGQGQRLGIFAGSGVGKSTLLGMMARNTGADINVIALIGERGREVREFLEKDLGPEGIARSVIIVATSDQPALVRMKGALVATAIAEYFRDQKRNVLFMMDSVTRFAAAQREIGLSIGEPPATRGYTPSVFSALPKLLERTGPGVDGTITAFYTVLVDGDDMNEPIADSVRGILDGHIVLSRKLAEGQHFPAIDVLKSISRVMPDIISPEHQHLASELKSNLAIYTDAEDLISIGAYAQGSNPAIDKAIGMIEPIKQFLKQDFADSPSWEETLNALHDTVNID